MLSSGRVMTAEFMTEIFKIEAEGEPDGDRTAVAERCKLFKTFFQSYMTPVQEWCKKQLKLVPVLRREQAELSKIWTAREAYRHRLARLYLAKSRDFESSGGLDLRKKPFYKRYPEKHARETAIQREVTARQTELAKLLQTHAETRSKLAHLSTLSSDAESEERCVSAVYILCNTLCSHSRVHSKTCAICLDDLTHASLLPCLHSFCTDVCCTSHHAPPPNRNSSLLSTRDWHFQLMNVAAAAVHYRVYPKVRYQSSAWP
jgi:hypothetical protein